MGARLLLSTVVGRFPRLSLLFADRAYTGPLLDWIETELGWDTEIVPKPENDSREEWTLEDGQSVCKPKPKGGFQVQRQRWKIERTLGWLVRYRRLARDYEGLPSSSEALIQIASIRLFLTRLAPFRSMGA